MSDASLSPPASPGPVDDVQASSDVVSGAPYSPDVSNEEVVIPADNADEQIIEYEAETAENLNDDDKEEGEDMNESNRSIEQGDDDEQGSEVINQLGEDANESNRSIEQEENDEPESEVIDQLGEDANDSNRGVEQEDDNEPESDVIDHAASPEPAIPSSPVQERLRNDADDDDESDQESPKKKKKLVLDSDDEEDDIDDDQSKSPEKKKRILMSSDEDSDADESQGLKKRLLGDVSDSDDDNDNKARGDEEVGDLIANIFGEESDAEDGEDNAAPADNDDEEGDQRYRRDDDPSMEWDFDTMLREKKALKGKKKRRRDNGIDIINDDDGTIALMVEAMKAATKDDRHSNMQRQPALRKRKMLPEVKTMLLRVDMVEAMIDNGMMSAVSDWLSPLPDKSLPALEIRTELLKLLQGFSRLEQSVLKQSGLGKAVMMLYKHPREVKPNKDLASKLIREWARPIFQLETDFRSVSKEERVQRDLDHMPNIKKRRLSTDEPGPSSKKQTSIQDGLKPGDKGYIGRARVPKPSTRDYVMRPRSTIDGEFKGERKGKAFNRLDKTQRDFMERTRKHKAKRAINVSLEGRNMAL